MTDKYTKDTKLEEVLRSKAASAVISKYRIPCLNCPMAIYEAGKLTLGQIAGNYGIDLKSMLRELNNN
jgi:hypothetical protein